MLDELEIPQLARRPCPSTSILFDVQPREFTPNTNVTLNATVLDAATNVSMPDINVTFYAVDGNNVSSCIGRDESYSHGIALMNWTYPASGVYAFTTELVGPEKIISSPVTLTLGRDTVLYLRVSKPGITTIW